MDSPNSLPRRMLAAGIGLFALWQMVFLVSANFIDLIPRGSADPNGIPLDPLQEVGTYTSFQPLQRATDWAGDVIDAYSEFTGQEQVWPLFAPGFPPHSTFTAIELRYANGDRVQIKSDFEPADYNHAPLRAPFVNVRRYNIEIQFTPPIMQHTEEAFQDPKTAQTIRDQTFAFFRGCQPILIHWLRWQLERYQTANPGHGTPAEVIYEARYVPSPMPGQKRIWDKPVRVRPLVRWHPGRETPPDELPLQVYDVSAEKWVTLLKDGGER